MIRTLTVRAPKPRHITTDQEALRRKRKTEWKRRQGGQSFVDNVIVTVRAGNGGDGCVAFHREKYKPFGPPSGGNGGRGGDVYLLPTSTLTSLSSVPTRIRGNPGGNGQGTWQNGRNGEPLIIKVPQGTVVRQVPLHDPKRAKDEWEAEEESLQGLDAEERRERMRESRWIHYPRSGESNLQRDTFKEAEDVWLSQERDRRLARRHKILYRPIHLDLDKDESFISRDPNAPLGTKHLKPHGYLIASGGAGGVGNPTFLSSTPPFYRSPKFASRGIPGERITLSLELKLLADISLVGMPNAGKSTLLRALTGGRARTAVAGYPFTTLNPVLGVVRVANDGMSYEGEVAEHRVVHDETQVEEAEFNEKMSSGAFAHASTRNQQASSRTGHRFDLLESFRFTIADNPGLISQASQNVGLGHSFLRSIERAHALVYVLDLSSPVPWDDLRILRDELEQYQAGTSSKARMVLANKADLLGDDDKAPVEDARQKLRLLEEYVHREIGESLDVVPISAKFSQNLNKAVGLMKAYVEQARVKDKTY